MTPPEQDPRRARRNVVLALVHVALAVGIMLLFMWTQAHK